jgi:hypothetical protein
VSLFKFHYALYMNKQVALSLENLSRVCVITGDTLSEDEAFVLPCCKQDISMDTIVTWLKQSHATGCPCCRDNVSVREALSKMGLDLSPIPTGPQSDTEVAFGHIFDGVMRGIGESPTIAARCKGYREFGEGLLNQGHYRLAHRLIADVGELMIAADRKEKPLLGSVVMTLLDRYNDLPSRLSGPTVVPQAEKKWELGHMLGQWRKAALSFFRTLLG